ncbi:YneF family protein [bacterium]|nr:YneF family protein [bacterium]
MPWWGVLLIGIGAFIVGGLLGAILISRYIKKYQEENPPITEKQVRLLFRQMGKTPSEKQVRQIMQSMNNSKEDK